MKTIEELNNELLKLEGLAQNAANVKKIDAIKAEILTLQSDVKTIVVNGTTCKVLTLKELNEGDKSIIISSMSDNDILTFPDEPVAVEVPFKLKGEPMTYVGIKCLKLDELSGKEKEFILSFGNFNPLVCTTPFPAPEQLNYVKINEAFSGMRKEEILTVVAGKKFLVKTNSTDFHSVKEWTDMVDEHGAKVLKENGDVKKIPGTTFDGGKTVVITSPKKVYKFSKLK